jgi:hypothetical protein
VEHSSAHASGFQERRAVSRFGQGKAVMRMAHEQSTVGPNRSVFITPGKFLKKSFTNALGKNQALNQNNCLRNFASEFS